MKTAIMVLGMGLGAFALTGCFENIGFLENATAEITEEDAIELVKEVESINLLNPSALLVNSSHKREKNLQMISLNIPTPKISRAAEEYTCSVGGTYTSEQTVTGNETHGKVIEIKKYHDCIEYASVIMNGEEKIIIESNIKGKIQTTKMEIEKKNFSYKIDDTHSYTATLEKTVMEADIAENGITTAAKMSQENSGTLVLGERTRTYKGLKVEAVISQTEALQHIDYTLSGEIDDSKYKGILVYSTPDRIVIDIKENSMACPHAGKIKIKGKAHEVTVEHANDYNVTVKFDNKVQKVYEDCTELQEVEK